MQGIDAQDQKSCDTDEGGCGTLNPVQCFLEGVPPPVFTLQLAWESHNESTEAISEVMDAVQEVSFSVHCAVAFCHAHVCSCRPFGSRCPSCAHMPSTPCELNALLCSYLQDARVWLLCHQATDLPKRQIKQVHLQPYRSGLPEDAAMACGPPSLRSRSAVP